MKKQVQELCYILRHTSDGFSSMKHYKTGSMGLAFAAALAWFLATIIRQQYTSFRFNIYNTIDTNIIYIFLGTVVVFLCFTVANWSVCTLFDGEGSYREIFIVTGYALIPYTFSSLLATLLSHVMGITESIFISILTVVGFLYSAYVLCVGLMRIHDYRFGKMLMSVIATLVFILLIIFLGFLLVTLFSQLFSFIGSVVDEVMTRGLT